MQSLKPIDQIRALARREFLIGLGTPAHWLNPAIFFVIVISLFPLGLGPEPARLAQIAVGLMWVVVILASTLGVGQLFESDYQAGILEQLVLGQLPMYWVVLVKLMVHWFLTGFPLILMVPVLSLMVYLPSQLLGMMVLTVLIGMPVVITINAVGAALTLAAQGNSILILLICLPLQIPVIILSTAAVQSYQVGLAFEGYLALLCALLLMSLALLPFAISAALRVAVQSR